MTGSSSSESVCCSGAAHLPRLAATEQGSDCQTASGTDSGLDACCCATEHSAPSSAHSCSLLTRVNLPVYYTAK